MCVKTDREGSPDVFRALLMGDKAGLGGSLDLTARIEERGGLLLVWHQEGCTLDPTGLPVEIRVRDEPRILPPSLASSILFFSAAFERSVSV